MLTHVAQKHATAILATARARLEDVASALARTKGATITSAQAIALAFG